MQIVRVSAEIIEKHIVPFAAKTSAALPASTTQMLGLERQASSHGSMNKSAIPLGHHDRAADAKTLPLGDRLVGRVITGNTPSSS
jgi:hypothetical protein